MIDPLMSKTMREVISDLNAMFRAHEPPCPDAPGNICVRVFAEKWSRQSQSLTKELELRNIGTYASFSHGGGEYDVEFSVESLASGSKVVVAVMAKRWPKLDYRIIRTPSSDEIMTEFDRRWELIPDELKQDPNTSTQIAHAPLSFDPTKAFEFLGEALESMREFLQNSDGDAQYTEREISRCESLVQTYLTWCESLHTEDDILEQVRVVVVALNELNQDCMGTLIETDQRESLCAASLAGATRAGSTRTDDLTFEWREW